jgi:xanthosine phosphorylase
VTAAADAIRARVPGAAPRVGLILGSGLGPLAAAVVDPVAIPYAELPGFRVPHVQGHAGALVLGRLGGREVAVLSGRSHLYEGVEPETITTPIRTLRALGAELLLVTNAAGSLRGEHPAGSLVVLADHINLTGFNPLVGPNDDAVGPRFPGMADAYDPAIRARLRAAGEALGTPLGEGVYLAVTGPSFETPAEIRAFRTLGADLVGMSTVAEVIAARHAGLAVGAISVVTNLAEGLGDEPLSHEQTLRFAAEAGARLGPVITRFLADLDRPPDAGGR